MRKINKIKKKNIISNEDIIFWEKFKKQNNLFFEDKDFHVHQNTKKFKFDLKFDFHGYSIEKAFKKVDEIFHLCKEKNFTSVLIITGKGLRSKVSVDPYKSEDLSLLRYTVPDYIKKNYQSRIISISVASIENGGEGAYELKLKKL